MYKPKLTKEDRDYFLNLHQALVVLETTRKTLETRMKIQKKEAKKTLLLSKETCTLCGNTNLVSYVQYACIQRLSSTSMFTMAQHIEDIAWSCLYNQGTSYCFPIFGLWCV